MHGGASDARNKLSHLPFAFGIRNGVDNEHAASVCIYCAYHWITRLARTRGLYISACDDDKATWADAAYVVCMSRTIYVYIGTTIDICGWHAQLIY